MKKFYVIILSGAVWLMAGVYLFTLGVNLVMGNHVSLGDESVAAGIIAAALFIGWAKGKFILRKTCQKTLVRLNGLQDPVPFNQVFEKKYLLLIAIMMSLGIMMRFVDPLLRGAVDVAIGTALIHGSMGFFFNRKESF